MMAEWQLGGDVTAEWVDDDDDESWFNLVVVPQVIVYIVLWHLFTTLRAILP
jgi:hypothetical protein